MTKKCKIKVNKPIDLDEIIIPIGTYNGYLVGVNEWPEIEYDGEYWDFVPDEEFIDVEFFDIEEN